MAIFDISKQTSGIYLLDDDTVIEDLQKEIESNQGKLYRLLGSQITSAAELHQEIATILAFPENFGHNWDALLDCLGDLSWLEGKLHGILYTETKFFAEGNLPDFKNFVDVLQEALKQHGKDSALFVFLQWG